MTRLTILKMEGYPSKLLIINGHQKYAPGYPRKLFKTIDLFVYRVKILMKINPLAVQRPEI